ncbi:nitroreductase family protein [Vreelandella arctica]|uniref:nitroreductase family protein n=1 Tax=Vreelandella arctica TaxID=3126499 RepID=UPI003D66ACCF
MDALALALLPATYEDYLHACRYCHLQPQIGSPFSLHPLKRATIMHILQIASRTPSGSNIQPWKVHVVAGTAKD